MAKRKKVLLSDNVSHDDDDTGMGKKRYNFQNGGADNVAYDNNEKAVYIESHKLQNGAPEKDKWHDATKHDRHADKKRKKKKDKDEPSAKSQSVGFFQLFRFSDGIDKVLIALGLFFGIAHGVSIQLNFVILAGIIDQYIAMNTTGNSTAEEELNALIPDIVFKFCGNASLVLVFGFIHIYCWTMTAERQIRVVRNKAFRSVMRQHMAWFDMQRGGEINIRLTSDILSMHNGMGDKVATFVQWVSTFVVGALICFSVGWELTLVMLAVSPLVVGMAALVARSLQTFATKEVKAYSDAGGIADEVLSAIRIVTAYNGQTKESDRYDVALHQAKKVGVRRGYAKGTGEGVLWLLIFGVISLAFWYGTKLIAQPGSGYTGGTLMQLQFSLFNGMRSLGQALGNLENFSLARSAAYQIYKLIDAQTEIDSSSTSGQKPQNMKGNIEFHDVTFSYPTRTDYEVLRNFTLKMEQGKTVAIVGPSGSGKSTIVQLIQRLYDATDGKVTLDGLDLRDLNVRWLREQIGVVSQEPVLFANSIAENIRFGCNGATQEDIERAARQANAHNFIMKMPQKYNTMVGSRGAQLSGGQKQRVAIARALVKNPRILILDDATSALDYQSEKIVQDALEKARHGRTTLIIAHRLSSVRNADVICCVDQGEIMEAGTHDELMAKGGLYCKLNKTQAEDDENADDIIYSESDDEDEDEDSDTGYEEGNMRESMAMDDLVGGSPLDPNFIFGVKRAMSTTSSMSSRPRSSRRASSRRRSSRRRSSAIERQISRTTSGGSEMDEALLEEAVEIPPNTVRRVFKMNASEWPFLFVGCIGAVAQGTVWPIFTFMVSEILAAFTEPDPQKMQDTINMYVVYIFLIGTGSAIATFLMVGLFSHSGEILTERLRSSAFKSMLRQEVGWFDERTNQVGSLTSRLATDASMVKAATGSALSSVVNATATMAIALTVAFFFGPELAAVAVLFVPPLIGMGMMQSKLLVGYAQGNKSAVEEAGKIVSEAVDNIKTVAALTKEDYFIGKFAEHSDESYKSGKKRSVTFGITWGVSQSIIFFGYAANYGFGSYLILTQGYTFEIVFRVFACISTGAIELGRVNAFVADYSKAKVSAAKLFTLFDRISLIDPFTPGETPVTCNGDVHFKEVHFSYPTRREAKILRGLDVKVPAGKTLALVGPSGCGKSTTIQLLERFYTAESGSVLLDSSNISTVDVRWLRSKIGLVAQEPTVFEATIRENIAYGDLSRVVPIEEVMAAARMANIHEFIEALPQGYDTVLGAGGIQMVGGQKQRVTIARALIGNPRILLLDEATSALDTASEHIVQEALDRAQEGRTSIVIAHRLSTIENADIIAVIDNGKVVEIGTHSELMKMNGLYFQLQQIQMGHRG